MHELERIENALATKDLDPTVFERCAQDLLTDIYPGLSLVPGGTDWGSDADVHDGTSETPRRLMVTKSRDYDSIRKNMVGGLKSLKDHDQAFDRIIIANPGSLNRLQRNNLKKAAAELGAVLEAVYDRGYFGSRLRRDGEWRKRLLGLSGVPITVSRVPWRLAESPGASLPLVGRDEVLAQIVSSDSDVVFVGKPGVGKTRLLAELPEAVFVDPDADEQRLADDIRWLSPRIVIVDDVASAPALARYLQRLRRQDADVLNFRLVVACWPDEIGSVRDIVPGALEVGVDLLERSEVDEIVRAMGISGVSARKSILDQAEGRPGWAVTLAELILRSGWNDVVTGKALIGEIDGYLRRAQLGINAKDLLATIAALRGIRDSDMSAISTFTGLARVDVRRLLTVVAQGGLLDVVSQQTREGQFRAYSVRPPMLAEAIAVESFYLNDVPLGDVDELIELWPDRIVDLVVTTCVAAILGSSLARSKVDRLVEGLLQSESATEISMTVYQHYIHVDEHCAARVLGWAAAAFEQLTPAERTQSLAVRWIVNIAHTIASLYFNREAVKLLLHIAMYQPMPANPGNFMPELRELCVSTHPDIGANVDGRILVSEALADWLPSDPSSEHWQVWTAAAKNVMTPHVSGSFASPESGRTLHLIEAIVNPDNAQLMMEQLWPAIFNRLQSSPDMYVAEFVDTLHEWLYVGSGHDRPFGNEHPTASIDKAAIVGKAILKDLAELSIGKPGLAVRVSSTASIFEIEVPSGVSTEIQRNPFFRDLEVVDNLDDAINALQSDIACAVSGWASEEPETVVARLIDLRTQGEVAHIRWPRRVMMACEALSAVIENSRRWTEEALEQGLFPDAASFVKVLIAAEGDDAAEIVMDCVRNQAARGETLHILLASEVGDRLQNIGIAELDSDDHELLELLAIRGELSRDTQRAIFDRARPGAGAALALALAGREELSDVSIAPDLLQPFLAAARDVSLNDFDRRAEGAFAKLLSYLSEKYPDTAEELVRRRLSESGNAMPLKALGSRGCEVLHLLPAANRTAVFESLGDNTSVRHMMLEYLVGPDIDWLESLLAEGRITSEEALSARRFKNNLTIAQMAKLLVPRGIEPARIAFLAQTGMSTGEQSDRYAALIKECEGYILSDDPSVAAVGAAGVEMFGRHREDALAREHQHRIRGYA